LYKKVGEDMEIIKQEITVDLELKKKIEMICSFCNVTPKIICGSIRSIEKTNISYVEPHRIYINDLVFLVFNGSTDIYLFNLNNKMNIKDLKSYLKNYQKTCKNKK